MSGTPLLQKKRLPSKVSSSTSGGRMRSNSLMSAFEGLSIKPRGERPSVILGGASGAAGGPVCANSPAALGATLAAHLTALGLVFSSGALIGIGLFLASALLAARALQRRQVARGVRKMRSVSQACRAAHRCFRLLAHLVSPVWTTVAILVEDPELRLLASILTATGVAVPCWETVVALAVQAVALSLLGRFEQAPAASIWAPPVVFALSVLNAFAQPGGQGLVKDVLTPMTERTEDMSARKSRAAFSKAMRCLPDWSPPTAREVQAFYARFDEDDELLGVYVCAVRAKINHQGQLFISCKRSGMPSISFHGATLLRSALEFSVSLDELSDVVCKVSSRDTAVLIFKKPKVLKGQREPVTEISLKVGERGLGALNAIFSVHRGTSDDEADSDDDEFQDAMSPSAGGDTQTASLREQFNAGDEPFSQSMEVHIPRLDLGQVAADLLSEDWGPSSFLNEYHTAVGAMDFTSGPCLDDSDSTAKVHIRELTFVMPVPPAPLCPKTTKVTATCRISVEAAPKSTVTIEFSCVSQDVPFGSNFVVQDRLVLSPASDNSVTFVKSGRVVFLKSVGFLKSKIQSGAASEGARTADVFLEMLRKRTPIESSPTLSPRGISGVLGSEKSPLAKQVQRTTCTQRVWELQRRTTLFHRDWRAPFLPHDGDKRWRWVDDSYSRHCWIRLRNREDAGSAQYPPLMAGANWKEQGRWKVVMDTADLDQEGWQYAVDFYRGDSFWSSRSTGMHCRRRLWSCTLTIASTTSIATAASEGPEVSLLGSGSVVSALSKLWS